METIYYFEEQSIILKYIKIWIPLDFFLSYSPDIVTSGMFEISSLHLNTFKSTLVCTDGFIH